jgi:hypothetical protein
MGGDLTKVHCKHIWKCHKETPVQVSYANKNVLRINKRSLITRLIEQCQDRRTWKKVWLPFQEFIRPKHSKQADICFG